MIINDREAGPILAHLRRGGTELLYEIRDYDAHRAVWTYEKSRAYHGDNRFHLMRSEGIAHACRAIEVHIAAGWEVLQLDLKVVEVGD